MKIFRFICFLFLAIFVSFNCGCQQRGRGDVIVQASTIDALLAGSYGGFMTLDELLTYGDTGIGTFDSLDGEMAVINGVAYQVRSNGVVSLPDGEDTTPFASVLWFAPDAYIEVEGCDYDSLCKQIKAEIGSDNIPTAIMIEGRFSFVHTRSVPKQNRPYPPLVEVVKNQPEFKAQDISGRLVGFYLPEFVSKINVPNFHLHFIADDLSFGGHLLDIKVGKAVVELDNCSQLNIILPISQDDFSRIDLKKDRTQELEKSENKQK